MYLDPAISTDVTGARMIIADACVRDFSVDSDASAIQRRVRRSPRAVPAWVRVMRATVGVLVLIWAVLVVVTAA